MATFLERQEQKMKKEKEKETGIKLYTREEVAKMIRQGIDIESVDLSCLWQDPVSPEGGIMKYIPLILSAITVLLLITLLLKK